MNRLILCSLAWLAAAALVSPGAAAQAPSADRLAWLGGCWRADTGDTSTVEQWLPPAGDSLVGLMRSVRQGAVLAQGFMQIRSAAGGGLVLVAQAAGRPETVYALAQWSDAAASFENEGAEFPQRLGYRLDEAGRLHVRREAAAGTGGGSETVLARVACDVQPPAGEAFQGLPWGAGEAQLALRFGPALVAADCKAPAARAALRAREACDHPVLPRYEVAGIPFRLALVLDERSRQLVRVTLQHVAEGDLPDGGWSEKHRLMRQLLTQRYGAPESTHVDSDGGGQQALARWRRGDTLIELASSFQPRLAGSRARERIEIMYLPVHSGEAGKL